MPSRTISLKESAYLRLEAAKWPGESFTDVIERLLGATRPSFRLFDGLLDKKARAAMAEAFAKMRTDERAYEQGRPKDWKRPSG